MQEFQGISLINPYDVYEIMMNYWSETLQDDVYAISGDGYEKAGRDVIKEYKKKQDGTLTSIIKDFEGRIIPKRLIIDYFFKDERDAIKRLEANLERIVEAQDTMREEHGDDDGLFCEVWVKKGKSEEDTITKESVKARLKEIEDSSDDREEFTVLERYLGLLNTETTMKRSVKMAKESLECIVFVQYSKLTLPQIKELVIEKKWCYDLFDRIDAHYSAIAHRLSARVSELAERYETPLPELEKSVTEYESKVKKHLERMGYAW